MYLLHLTQEVKGCKYIIVKFMFQEEKKLRGRKGCKNKRVTAGTGSCNYTKVISQPQHQINEQRLGMRRNERGRKNMVEATE